MLAAEIAAAMNISLSTYEKFEGGRIRLNPDYIHRFARVTGSDHRAIQLSVMMESPAMALHASRTHLVAALLLCFREACSSSHHWMGAVDFREALRVFSDAFGQLKELTERRQRQAAALMPDEPTDRQDPSL